MSIGEAPIRILFFFGVSFVLYSHFSVVNGQCLMLHLVLVVAFVVATTPLSVDSELDFSVNFRSILFCFSVFVIAPINVACESLHFLNFIYLCGAPEYFRVNFISLSVSRISKQND